MDKEEKENIQNLISNNDRGISLNDISIYFNEIFNDLLEKEGNNSKYISLDIFKSYFQLPYFISQILYMNVFEGNKSNIDNQQFIRGMILLYFSPIQKKIKTIFKFYDVLNVDKICTDDIVLILRHFHLHTKNNNFEHFENLIKYSLGFNYKNKELTYDDWKIFLSENSDLFIITVYFLEYFKPFKSQNIIYLLKTKTYKRRKSIDFHSRSLKTDYVKPNIFIELSDCSSILFEYINDTFKLSLEYKEILSDNDDEMNTLNEFENEKIKKFINLAEEGGKKVNKKLKNSFVIGKKSFNLDNDLENKNNNKTETKFERRKKQFKTTILNTKQFRKKMKIKSSVVEKGVSSVPTFFLNNKKLDCFIFPSKINDEDEETKVTLYIMNDDIFVFYYPTIFQNNLISFHKIINIKNVYPSLDTEIYNNKKYFVLKLYVNYLKVYSKNSNINVSPFVEYYCENKEHLIEFYNVIAQLINKQKPIKELFDLNNDLINGQTGIYYKCYNKKNLIPYIIKIISKNSIVNENILQIRNECDIFDFLLNIKDENLLTPIMKIEDSSHLYFIFEYPTEGQLLFFLQKIEENKLANIKYFLIIILKSLFQFHRFGFFYDDVILNSIFVFKEENKYVGKIITFENMKFIFRKQLLKSSPNNPERYHSPEFPPEESNGEFYNLKVDTWQIGSLIYILLFQNMPFGRRDSNIIELKNKVNYNQLIIPQKCAFDINENENDLLNSLKDIIFSCLHNNYKKRPLLKDILSIINN